MSKVKQFSMQWGMVAPRSDYIPPGGKVRRPKDAAWDDAYGALVAGVMAEHVKNTKMGGVAPVAKSQEAWLSFDPAVAPDYPASMAVAGPAWDQGLFTLTYSAARFKAFAEFQAMLTGKKSPAEAPASYERELNAVLARNK